MPRAKIEKSLPVVFGTTLDEALAGYRAIVNRGVCEEAGELAEEVAEEKAERRRRILEDIREYERAVEIGRAVNAWDWKHWVGFAVAVAALVVGILALVLG